MAGWYSVQEQEDRDYEMGAGPDYAAELFRCGGCRHLVVDPAECCAGPDEEPEAAYLPPSATLEPQVAPAPTTPLDPEEVPF